MGRQWTMDNRRWVGANVLPPAHSIGREVWVVGGWKYIYQEAPAFMPDEILISPSGGGRGRMVSVKWRIYGTLIFLWLGALLQSFCHYVAILANRFSDWNAVSLKRKRHRISHVEAMPHRGYLLVDNSHSKNAPMPHRGYPLVTTAISFPTLKTKTNA
jgi:hypothetical protein